MGGTSPSPTIYLKNGDVGVHTIALVRRPDIGGCALIQRDQQIYIRVSRCLTAPARLRMGVTLSRNNGLNPVVT